MWFTAYPISFITRSGESFLAALGDEELWKAFAAIGIEAVHTGPVKRAGGIAGWRYTPSVDGHFDGISTQIDRPSATSPSSARCAAWPPGTAAPSSTTRARAHRQGRGLPARRNEGRGYPGIHLMGVAPRARKFDAGMPRGRSLYGSIPDQLDDETSFVRQLQAILAMRRHYGIATSTQIDIPDVSHKGMLVLVHQLGDPAQLQLTVLNFADEPIAGTVRSEALPPGGQIKDMFTNEPFGTVDDLRSFAVGIEAHHGMSLLVRAPEADPPEA